MTRVVLGRDCVIHSTSRLGGPFRQLLDGSRDTARHDISLGERCWVGDFAWLGEGVTIGDGSVVDHHCLIEPGVSIGAGVLVTHRAQICSDAVIGDSCVIGGFVGDRTRIEERSRFFGKALHAQTDPSRPWDADGSREAAPTIRADSFVGFGAAVIGDVVVGPRAYVCANAVVSRTVPPGHIASHVNRLTHFTDWPGPLADCPIFAG
ncbi:hypothetical protein DPM19_21275 [Actinomadura craniellae]|uniref:Acyltransferase n=1 Tax=Actinomadura craniellae TaxID=2231787 RepID=A0A365H1X5_9ACTN|nr:hypothetical protein [Actinomadura craniellae]RAY13039.1 hypothetical protein DPM19_21275 [Actinomadura craniellae]